MLLRNSRIVARFTFGLRRILAHVAQLRARTCTQFWNCGGSPGAWLTPAIRLTSRTQPREAPAAVRAAEAAASAAGLRLHVDDLALLGHAEVLARDAFD